MNLKLVQAGEKAVEDAVRQGINMSQFGRGFVDFLRGNRIGVGNVPEDCMNIPIVRITENEHGYINISVSFLRKGGHDPWIHAKTTYSDHFGNQIPFRLPEVEPEKPNEHWRQIFRVAFLPTVEASRQIKSQLASSYYKRGLPGLFEAIEQLLDGKARIKAHAVLILRLLPRRRDYPLLDNELYNSCCMLQKLIRFERHPYLIGDSWPA